MVQNRPKRLQTSTTFRLKFNIGKLILISFAVGSIVGRLSWLFWQ